MSNKLETFIKTMEKEFGEGILMIPELGISIPNEKIDVISSGSPLIDKILGVGGFPRGRLVEILGTEASGKTTLALSTVAEAQKAKLRCAYIDTEQSLDRKRAEEIGVNFNALVFSQPDSAEQALDLLDYMIVSQEFGVIVLDSIAALVPKAELEGDMSDANIGLQARLMGKILRKIASPTKKNNVLVIFINQLRQKIGGWAPMPIEIGSGGNAMKYYATIRIDMRRTGQNKSQTDPKSSHKVKTKKNKLAMPMQEAIVVIGKNGFEN